MHDQLDGDFRDENDGEGNVGNKPANGLLCVVHVNADVDCIEQDHGTHDAVQQRLELLLGHVFPQVFDVLRFVLQRLLVGLALLLMDLGVQKHLLQHPRLSLCRGLHGRVECGLSRGNPTHRDLCCRPCWLILGERLESDDVRLGLALVHLQLHLRRLRLPRGAAVVAAVAAREQGRHPFLGERLDDDAGRLGLALVHLHVHLLRLRLPLAVAVIVAVVACKQGRHPFLDLDHRGMHLGLARGEARELAPHGHQLFCELGHAELDRAPLTTTHACCDLLDMCVQTVVREAALLRAGEALLAHRG
mmetsp:Transcript_35194/g.101149  ORF Transcript_35194/g.101149 Transcript_35194/m.101149 type:complete len:304 (-) Transcript_35194:152-1063(-)